MINRKLEDIIIEKKRPQFKSEGERKIAYFLERNDIQYQYEPPLLVSTYDDKQRIWYPDFYLPEFATYIEYFGLAGKKDYDEGIQKKETIYKKMELDVIKIYPSSFADKWEGYIMQELEDISIRRYRSLMSKPYWSKQQEPAHESRFQRQKPYSTLRNSLY